MSLALRHKKKCLAALKKQQVSEVTVETAAVTTSSEDKDDYVRGLVESNLENDLQLLSERKEISEKIALKRELLPRYLPHAHKYMASGAKYPNLVLVQCVIWLIDVGDIEQALMLANYAIEQQQSMPERFKRDLPTYVAEELHDWAEREYKAQRSPFPYFSEVLDAVQSDRWPIFNKIVLGKLYRMAGLLYDQEEDFAKAVHWYEKAEQVNDKAGVKTRLEMARKKL
ncbi:phage terminase small subunit [uncultured Microbulbifer sp.]|uniref:phage terminase small subunit n=1 Tax=uncultured Microbulbifer sp. TaxID=348147 RepID=UPI00260DD0F5|nr:phage terminase small subunit [uncultured Microbulbifer sp.]